LQNVHRPAAAAQTAHLVRSEMVGRDLRSLMDKASNPAGPGNVDHDHVPALDNDRLSTPSRGSGLADDGNADAAFLFTTLMA